MGDLALTWDLFQDQVSYGLKKPLLEHCLRQLLSIAAPEADDARP